MNEIILAQDFTKLQNKNLTVKLTAISKEIANGNKASWHIAENFKAILDGEMFNMDFADQKEFATYVGISAGALTQFKKAVEFAVDHKIDRNTTMLSVTVAYELSAIKDFPAFTKFLNDKGINDITILTLSRVKELKKEFKQLNSNKLEDKTAETETAETETAETTETETAETEIISRDDIIAKIKQLMADFNITVDDLK